MSLDQSTKDELASVMDGFYDRPLEKAREFDWQEFQENEPFKYIMMPNKAFWVIANFERSFTQKLGSTMYEKFAVAVANANDDVGDATTQHKCTGLDLTQSQEGCIESIIADLDDKQRDPDWNDEVEQVLNADQFGARKSISSITWDLWVEDFHNGRPLACEIKSPKPNRDQTMESKRQMLKTVAAYEHSTEPTPIVIFVFPFNPYGHVDDYDWWPTQQFFDVTDTESMLVAHDFWDTLSGEVGTTDDLLEFLQDESTEHINELWEIASEEKDDD